MQIENIKIIKQLNILKAYLSVGNFSTNEIIELLPNLFNDDKHKISIDLIKLEVENKNYDKAQNILVELKQNLVNETFKIPCNQNWELLISTEDSKTKFCKECSKNVYLVDNETEFIKRKNLEQCVAFNTADFTPKKDYDKNYKSCHLQFNEIYELGFLA